MSYPVLMMIGGAFLFLFAPLFARDRGPQFVTRIRMNGLLMIVIGIMFAFPV